jgi:hypothetical protein
MYKYSHFIYRLEGYCKCVRHSFDEVGGRARAGTIGEASPSMRLSPEVPRKPRSNSQGDAPIRTQRLLRNCIFNLYPFVAAPYTEPDYGSLLRYLSGRIVRQTKKERNSKKVCKEMRPHTQRLLRTSTLGKPEQFYLAVCFLFYLSFFSLSSPLPPSSFSLPFSPLFLSSIPFYTEPFRT